MALVADELRKTYAGTEVVAGLSFAVQPGTCFGLLGPNGAGKTTTLRLCLGLTAPDSGAVSLNGFAIPADTSAFPMPRSRSAFRNCSNSPA